MPHRCNKDTQAVSEALHTSLQLPRCCDNIYGSAVTRLSALYLLLLSELHSTWATSQPYLPLSSWHRMQYANCVSFMYMYCSLFLSWLLSCGSPSSSSCSAESSTNTQEPNHPAIGCRTACAAVTKLYRLEVDADVAARALQVDPSKGPSKNAVLSAVLPQCKVLC